MSYNPRQARGLDGKWIARTGLSAIEGTRPKRKKKAKPGYRVTPSNSGKGRGSGIKGLTKNTVPYARVNKRSSTIGVNTGTIIPGTKKRVVAGGYVKFESINRQTKVDVLGKRVSGRIAPTGSRRGKIAGWAKKNVKIKNPALRVALPHGAEARLSTSRRSGKTVVVRRGQHKVSVKRSRAGVQRYDKRMATIAGRKAKSKASRKKSRPQRRRARKKSR